MDTKKVKVRQALSAASAAPVVLEAEIERIRTSGLEDLRVSWGKTFKREVPKAFTRDLLVRTLCWDIQEKAFGGHSPTILKLLDSYAKGKPVDRLRYLKPGTEIVREYCGERHSVTIAGGGFLWRGKAYSSLTAIACEITGAKWNGPRFFGLRDRDRGASARGARG